MFSPSVLFSCTAAAAKSLKSCPTLCDPIDASYQAPQSLGFSSKNTGLGSHFLLQCMKVKSESEVAQLCPTLSDLMDCSLPGSSVRGIFQARVLEWGAIAFSRWKWRKDTYTLDLRRQSWVTDFTLVRLQKIESNMDTDLREPNEVLRSLHINYLEFFKHFLSIYFSVTARYWACRDEDRV